jgi:hypothetical protein
MTTTEAMTTATTSKPQYFVEFFSYWANAQSHFVGPFDTKEAAEARIERLESRHHCNFYQGGQFNQPQNIKLDQQYYIRSASQIAADHDSRVSFAIEVSQSGWSDDGESGSEIDISAITNKRLHQVAYDAL